MQVMMWREACKDRLLDTKIDPISSIPERDFQPPKVLRFRTLWRSSINMLGASGGSSQKESQGKRLENSPWLSFTSHTDSVFVI